MPRQVELWPVGPRGIHFLSRLGLSGDKVDPPPPPVIQQRQLFSEASQVQVKGGPRACRRVKFC